MRAEYRRKSMFYYRFSLHVRPVGPRSTIRRHPFINRVPVGRDESPYHV